MDDAQLRMAFDDAEPDQAHHRHHGLEGMGDDVAGGVRLHALAEGRQIGRARVVDAHRQAELLDGRPQRVVRFVVQIAPGDGIGAHVEAGGAQPGDAARFLHGEVRRLHRQHRRHAQPPRGMAAVFQAPVVVGAAHGRQQRRVLELAPKHLAADRGIEHLRVHAVFVHVADARARLEAFGAALFVLLHAARGGFEKLLRVHGVVAVLLGDRLAFHAHAGAPVAHVADARGAIGEDRIDVVRPDVRRLHLVRIGVDDAIAVAHGVLPPKPAAKLTRLAQAVQQMHDARRFERRDWGRA